MSLEPVTFTPIGVIRTPFSEPAGMPVQSVGAAGMAARSSSIPRTRRAWRTWTRSAISTSCTTSTA